VLVSSETLAPSFGLRGVTHYYCTLKMETVRCSETVATKYQTIRRHIPEGINHQTVKVSSFPYVSNFLTG